MKKKKLLILLCSVFLMLVGCSVFLISFFNLPSDPPPVIYPLQHNLQQIEINFKKTELILCPDTATYIELIGYRESEYFISEENGKLIVSDESEKIKLSGVGKYLQESFTLSAEKKIIFHISPEYQENNFSLVVKNSTLTISAPLTQLTLYAENSSIFAENMIFERFHGNIKNSTTVLSISHPDIDFSRHIETHNAQFLLNGDERANTVHYESYTKQNDLTLDVIGGICTISFPTYQIENKE